MQRLNYFAPFESKPADYEDQLTRAFLVVARYVPMVQAALVDLIRQRQTDAGSKTVIPPLTQLTYDDLQVETQTMRNSRANGQANLGCVDRRVVATEGDDNAQGPDRTLRRGDRVPSRLDHRD